MGKVRQIRSLAGRPLKRRRVIASLGGGLLSPGIVRAQSSAKPPYVGILVDSSAPHPIAEGLPRALAALGYIEGRNIVFDTRYANSQAERGNEQAKELVRVSPAVIVAHFTPPVRAAMAATKTIPIVMAPAGAPLELGLVASLSRPGGNVTGVSNMAAELGGRRLQLLKDIVPSLKRVAILASTQDTFTQALVRYMKEAGSAAGIAVVPVMVAGPEDFEAAFAAMVRDHAQAAVLPAIFDASRAVTVELATRHRVPLMAITPEPTRAGGLISISADAKEIYRRAASIVDRILKGANPANIPVEQPTTFELVVNLGTARTLGLVVPQSLLFTADEVIE